jgi:hypothetical protein
MLLLDQPIEAAGLTLYRDHADPATFHVMPGPPRAVAGEGGGIELIRYRGTAGAAGESGGLLRLAVDLAPAAEAKEAARAELAARFGVESNLVPVVFDRGGVRLVALGVAGPAAYRVLRPRRGGDLRRTLRRKDGAHHR